MMRTRIFQPLGMRDTDRHRGERSPRSRTSPRRTRSSTVEVRVIENVSVDPVAAAGSVWSNVDDMAKWMQFLLDGGRVGGASGKRLLSEGGLRRALHAADDRARSTCIPRRG